MRSHRALALKEADESRRLPARLPRRSAGGVGMKSTELLRSLKNSCGGQEQDERHHASHKAARAYVLVLVQAPGASVVGRQALHRRIVGLLWRQRGEQRQHEAQRRVTQAEDHPDIDGVDHAHVGRQLPQHADHDDERSIEDDAALPLRAPQRQQSEEAAQEAGQVHAQDDRACLRMVPAHVDHEGVVSA